MGGEGLDALLRNKLDRLEAAGFDIRVALERDGDACSTLRANRTWTVIDIVTHDPKLAARCARVITIEEGQIASDRAPE